LNWPLGLFEKGSPWGSLFLSPKLQEQVRGVSHDVASDQSERSRPETRDGFAHTSHLSLQLKSMYLAAFGSTKFGQ